MDGGRFLLAIPEMEEEGALYGWMDEWLGGSGTVLHGCMARCSSWVC